MSVKGITKELFVGKTESNIINFWGNKTTIPYIDLKLIEYQFADKKNPGNLTFIKRTNEKIRFDFASSANEPILRTVDYLQENVPDLTLTEIERSASTNTTTLIEHAKTLEQPKMKEYRGSLKCPKCKGHNIELWSNEANYKIKQQTSLNINPLKPLTLFNTKTAKKGKKSATKIGLGVMTGGMSVILTGTKKKSHNEYYCKDCGHRWIGK